MRRARGLTSMRTSWLRDPLLHFVLAGSLLFGAYDWLDRDEGEPSGVLRLTAADVEWLSAQWQRQQLRAPSDVELRRLVTGFVREKLLAREARALGLDEDDTVVRRRLAQKMEFLLQDAVLLAGPDDTEIRRLYDGDRSRYANATSVSFAQAFFSDRADAERGLAALENEPLDDVGEPTLLARRYEGLDEATVSSLFGSEFAESLASAAPGEWRGPFRSAYGFHLVRVTERRPAEPLPFEEIRERVRADWLRDRQEQADEQLLRSLLEKYELVVDDAVEPWLGPLASTRR